MSDSRDALLDRLAKLGEDLSPELARSLAKQILDVTSPQAAATVYAPTPPLRHSVRELSRLWGAEPDVPASAIALALEAAQRTAEVVDGRQSLELIWTGPRTGAVPLRRTEQALLEVVASAEGDLLVVSFAAYKVDAVVGALEEALNRGVNVALVLESARESQGKITFDGLDSMGHVGTRCSVYHWPREKRQEASDGSYGSLHAKVAVADERLAFISSANLTGYAMELNMELGVLVKGGPVPVKVVRHFRGLIEEGVLELAL